MPDVVDPGARLRDQHGAFGRLAVGTKPRRAVRLDDGTVAAEPARMLDAAGEAPASRRPIAAVDRDRLGVRSDWTPGHHRARVAENVARHLGLDIGGGHGAAARLDGAPGGAAVGLGEFLDRLHEGRGLDLEPAATPWNEHAEQLRIVQGGEYFGRDLPRPLRVLGVRSNQGSKRACPRDAITTLRGRSSIQHRGFRLSRYCRAFDAPVNAPAGAPANAAGARDTVRRGPPRSGGWRPSRPR